MKRGFTTTEIADLFGYSDAVIRKKLKELNFPHEIKKVSGYKNGIYKWYPQDIDIKMFNKLNDKKIYNGIKSFRDIIKKYQEEEENKRKILQLQKEENKRQKEEELKEINRLSKEIASLYEHTWYNNDSKYILHIGATNSGKTYESIQRLKQAKRGQYLAPLRLLAHEIYEDLNNDNIGCNLFTGEEIIDNGYNISSRIIEMADYNNHYDVVIIDECFMISDADRGKGWLNAIMNIKSDEIHIILNLESEKLITDILEKTNKDFIINRYERKVPLVMGQNFLSATKGHMKMEKTIHVFFSRISCLVEKHRLEKSGNNVSIIYGSLPPEVKRKQMDDFRNGVTNVLVATDAIAMGLNLPCDNIVFREIDKYDGQRNRRLTSTEIKQIAGRAGRYGLSDKGVVYGYTKEIHNYVREKLNTKKELNSHAYYGVDINIVKQLDGESLDQKLNCYSKLNLVPDKLKDIIKHEPINKYMEVLTKVYYYSNVYKLNPIDIDNLWKIITIPYNSKYDMLKDIVESVSKNEKLILKNIKTIYPDDANSLGDAEELCKSLDSFLNFTTKFPELINSSNVADIVNIKNKQYDLINSYLLDKKLSSRKKCISCNTNITINTYHTKCDECYNKGRVNYYDNYRW